MLTLLITVLLGAYVYKKMERKMYGRNILFRMAMFGLTFFVLYQLVKLGTGLFGFLFESLFYIVLLVAVIYVFKKIGRRHY